MKCWAFGFRVTAYPRTVNEVGVSGVFVLSVVFLLQPLYWSPSSPKRGLAMQPSMLLHQHVGSSLN